MTAVNLGLTVIASLAVPAAITCDRVHTWSNFDGAVTVAALTATCESHLSIDVRICRRLFHCCGCSFVGDFRLTRRWRELDSTFGSGPSSELVSIPPPSLETQKRPGSQSRILTTDSARFTVHRARLAPAMISMPGHRVSRRRQREALPAWRAFSRRAVSTCHRPTRVRPTLRSVECVGRIRFFRG